MSLPRQWLRPGPGHYPICKCGLSSVCNYRITAQTWLTPGFCPGSELATYTRGFLPGNIYRRGLTAHQKHTAISLQYSNTRRRHGGREGGAMIPKAFRLCDFSNLATSPDLSVTEKLRLMSYGKSVRTMRSSTKFPDKWERETFKHFMMWNYQPCKTTAFRRASHTRTNSSMVILLLSKKIIVWGDSYVPMFQMNKSTYKRLVSMCLEGYKVGPPSFRHQRHVTP